MSATSPDWQSVSVLLEGAERPVDAILALPDPVRRAAEAADPQLAGLQRQMQAAHSRYRPVDVYVHRSFPDESARLWSAYVARFAAFVAEQCQPAGD